jgi:hypothetical protein
MSVDADYARVVETMRHALPAYVAYLQRDVVRGMASAESQSRIVVRTADKKIVHGKDSLDVSVVKRVFDPGCYRPTGEATTKRNGRTVLSFTLAPTCGSADKEPFTTLYVDPASMRPIEAAGVREHDRARVSIEEKFSTVREWSVPSSLKIDVEGSGFAFWLHVHVLQTFSEYGFYASDPGPGPVTAAAPRS